MKNKDSVHHMLALLVTLAMVFLLAIPFWLSWSLLCCYMLVSFAFLRKYWMSVYFSILAFSALSFEFNGLKRFFESAQIEVYVLVFSVVSVSFTVNFLLFKYRKRRVAQAS